MADTSAEAKPLRRRAAILLGQWAVKLPATERPAAYRSLITLMAEGDAAVHLAAVSGLKFLPTVQRARCNDTPSEAEQSADA